MRWRPLLFVATVALAVATWASPAAAKGPDQATITGPGLDSPIAVTGFGEPGSAGNLGELADGSGLFVVMFGPYDSERAVSEAPTGDLGPKYEITYHIPDGTSAGSTVRQDLYPQAPGGPVTYTPAGQSAMGIITVNSWYQTPAGFGRVLERLGIPVTGPVAGPEARPVADPRPVDRTVPASRPIVGVVVAAALVIAASALGLGVWRAVGRRARPLPTAAANQPR